MKTMSLVKTSLVLKASISSKTYRLFVVLTCGHFSYLAIPKLELSYKVNKGQITLLDLFVPIILYFFTSDNADETFKFGIFQYHCSVFFTRQGTVSILFVCIFPCYSIIISLIEIFLIFSEYIYIIIS